MYAVCDTAVFRGALCASVLLSQRRLDLLHDDWIVDGRRHGPRLAVRDLLDGSAQDFPGTRFWQPCHRDGELERSHRADLLAHEPDAFLLDLDGRAVDAGLEHEK